MKFRIIILLLLFNIILRAKDHGTFKDKRDGNKYKWVKIGQQTWMAENLKYLPMLSDTSQILSTKNPNYYVYEFYGNNLDSAKASYSYSYFGVLYNWKASQDACPSGWHLPSNNEWIELDHFIYSEHGDTIPYEKWNSSGKYLKEAGNVLDSTGFWLYSSNKYEEVGFKGTDYYGFSARPGGQFGSFFHSYRFNFFDIYESGFWWTSTNETGMFSNVRSMEYDRTYFRNFTRFKHNGASIRCIKD